MADLVDQHMRDQMIERFVIFGPVVEHRPAVEEHHVGHVRRLHHRAVDMGNALIKAEQVERALKFHLGGDLVVREILDADDEPRAARAKAFRQARKGHVGELFEFLQRGRLDAFPVHCSLLLHREIRRARLRLQLRRRRR